MSKLLRLHNGPLCLILVILSIWVSGQENNPVISKEIEIQRSNTYENELADYLKSYLVDDYDQRTARAWHRDYSSVDAFERSVKSNWERWQSIVIKPPLLIRTGSLKRKHYQVDSVNAEWLELPLGRLKAEAILAFPDGADEEKPVPVVIIQHGIGGVPENLFEKDGEPSQVYHAFAISLLNVGFAVLAPFNLPSVDRRNHIENMCQLADISLPGIELVRLQNLLDVVLEDPRINKDRVGMWRLSLGGMATMFFMPLEARIKVGVVSGWFNARCNKMVVSDKRYSSFWPAESHAFFSGWLTEFSDADVVSLVCPRPMMILTGKKDGIAHWPQVVNEFKEAMVPYERLNIGNRIKLLLDEGGHEVVVDEGIKFLTKWL